MPITALEYDQIPKFFLTHEVDWVTDTIKAALVTDGYTHDSAHGEWADASTHELSDASYAALTVSGKVILTDRIDCDDLSWSALTGTFRYVIFYMEGVTLELTNPLLLCIDMGANQTVSSSSWSLPINANGLFTY